MKCPCCGGEMPRDPVARIDTLPLSPSERVIANFYARRLGRWTTNADASDYYYSGTNPGRHCAVKVYVSGLKRKLREIGLQIEYRGLERRMMWLT